jgi:hypothetical protein
MSETDAQRSRVKEYIVDGAVGVGDDAGTVAFATDKRTFI